MFYTMLLKPHSNVRYQQSLLTLAMTELRCALKCFGIAAEPELITLGGKNWLSFEAENLSEEAWHHISSNAGCCMNAERNGEWLRPLEGGIPCYYPDELPQLLKYKGKTNADFTQMLIHCARYASDFASGNEPLLVLDPMCGKGTTLFCALVEGHNALGSDVDTKALNEADTYFARSLKLHRFKHKREENSLTMPKGRSVRMVHYSLSNTPEAWKQGDKRTLRLLQGDQDCLSQALQKSCCHIAVADLPYGVQHAPSDGGRTASLDKLVDKTARVCADMLKKGGAAALSFNTYTLQRRRVEEALEKAGLVPLRDAPYNGFAHWVEQAVDRDAVIAVKL